VLNVENQDEDLEDFKTCAVALAEENAKLKVLYRFASLSPHKHGVQLVHLISYLSVSALSSS
jgi:hypothetical protein